VRPFGVAVAGLVRGREQLVTFELEGTLPELAVTSSWVAPDEPIVVRGQAEAVGEGILVALELATTWHGECVRCLGEAGDALRAKGRELFVEGQGGEEVYGFRGYGLDLAEMVHDLVLLALPPVPLCRVGCKGLCPTCGADRNLGPCACRAAV
jgi:uncharacterized protein